MHTHTDAGLIVKLAAESHIQFPVASIIKFVAAEQLVQTVADEHR
jgi:hypothetical protein